MSLHAAFRVHRPTLTVDVTLDVEDGAVLALVGPNGAGKTTILEAIAGIVPIDGTIELDGVSIGGLPAERRRIGFGFQDGMLFPRLSALENVAFPARARGVRAATARAKARDLLARLAPSVTPSRRPAELSGGERQRVALARTLASEPAALLLDEPLGAVDASARPALRDAIRGALEGFAGPAILVTHDPVEAMTLGDRLALLEAGSVTQLGTPAEIRDRPATRYAADLVGINLFVGTLRPLADGSGELRTADGLLEVAWPDGIPRREIDDVRATLGPAEISVHASRPEGSARNVFAGRILELAMLGDRARVRLSTAPALVAELTRGSVERMRLEPGTDVWASCKAVEIRLMVPAAEPDTL
jgi:molybdate transport system ATP-binding protein